MNVFIEIWESNPKKTHVPQKAIKVTLTIPKKSYFLGSHISQEATSLDVM